MGVSVNTKETARQVKGMCEVEGKDMGKGGGKAWENNGEGEGCSAKTSKGGHCREETKGKGLGQEESQGRGKGRGHE